MKTCSVEGCSKKVQARGLCSTYYSQARNRGDFGTTGKQCKNLGCSNPVHARGYCQSCYAKLFQKSPGKKVVDHPGEQWAEIESHPGLMVSTMGRVKSVRTRNERLLKQRFVKPTGAKQPSMIANKVLVHTEVLRAFAPSQHGDRQVVFKNGDRSDCRLENLAWYGPDYLLEKAIKAAEESESPWADCFLKFWHGENNALDQFWEQMRPRIAGYIRNAADTLGYPGW